MPRCEWKSKSREELIEMCKDNYLRMRTRRRIAKFIGIELKIEEKENTEGYVYSTGEWV